ncbi:hypothetical protein BDR26DRAFT_995813 [Obelidium mucronatum]|nr:hypothetical protein BDR26DRAFT_995813 [Obelidium mucronatum]
MKKPDLDQINIYSSTRDLLLRFGTGSQQDSAEAIKNRRHHVRNHTSAGHMNVGLMKVATTREPLQKIVDRNFSKNPMSRRRAPNAFMVYRSETLPWLAEQRTREGFSLSSNALAAQVAEMWNRESETVRRRCFATSRKLQQQLDLLALKDLGDAGLRPPPLDTSPSPPMGPSEYSVFLDRRRRNRYVPPSSPQPVVQVKLPGNILVPQPVKPLVQAKLPPQMVSPPCFTITNFSDNFDKPPPPPPSVTSSRSSSFSHEHILSLYSPPLSAFDYRPAVETESSSAMSLKNLVDND